MQDVAGFRGERRALPDIDAIEQSVARQLRALERSVDRAEQDDRGGDDGYDGTGSSGDDDRAAAARASEVEVDGFVSHQPQYQQALVAKKLLLYEKQLQHRNRQLEQLEQRHSAVHARVEALERQLERSQQELAAAQEDWEEERAMLLRFRGAGTGASGAAGLGAMMRLSASGAATAAARSSRLKELERQRQSEMKMQLLRGAAEAQEQLDAEMDAAGVSARGASGRFRVALKKLERYVRRSLDPFATDVRQIEARFGYSVASYFRFFRWVVLSFMATALPSLVGLVLHVLHLMARVRDDADWRSFAGLAPRFLLLSGYAPDEALAYATTLVLAQALLLLFTLRKWVAEDERAKALDAVEGSDNKPRYSRIVLNAWDFSLSTHEDASDLKRSIAEQIKVALEVEKLAETLRMRSRGERYRLYARRFVALALYLVIQASCWYVIVLLTTESAQIQATIAATAAVLAPYASSLVPAVVTLINALLPPVIALLTRLERWDDAGFAIKAMVTRLYVAKVLNVVIQLFSYALLLDPYLLTASAERVAHTRLSFDGSRVRRNVMLAFKPDTYACRAEQVASGLLALVVTDFTLGKVAGVAAPVVRVALTTAARAWQRVQRTRRARSRATAASAVVVPLRDGEDTDPARSSAAVGVADEAPQTVVAPAQLAPHAAKSEFLVPQKMVALLYSCTIALLAVPLAPATALLALGLHAVNFKFDKLYLVHFQRKPTSPWSAKDAGHFFIKFYVCTILVSAAWTHHVLQSQRLPKQCALQDALLHDDALCEPGTYDAVSETCTIRSTHASAAYFAPALASSSSSSSGGGDDSSHECATGYPHCICAGALACGPFAASPSGYARVVAAIQATDAVAPLYALVLESNAVAWTLLGVVLLALFFLRNSIKVHVLAGFEREQAVELTFASLKKKIKQLEGRARLHAKFAHESHSSGDAKSGQVAPSTS